MKHQFFAVGKRIFSTSRLIKLITIVAFDSCAALLALWIAFSLLFGRWHSLAGQEWIISLFATLLMLLTFLFFGIYKSVQRFNSFESFVALFKSVTVYGILFFGCLFVLNFPKVPVSAGILQPVLLLLITGGSRALLRSLSTTITSHSNQQSATSEKVLVYGAGAAGVEIVSAINRSKEFIFYGFIDDDTELQGRSINGKPVFTPAEVVELIRQKMVTTILIAIPSINRARRNAIIEQFHHYPVQIKMLPGVEELVAGKITVSDIKPVDIEEHKSYRPITMADNCCLCASTPSQQRPPIRNV